MGAGEENGETDTFLFFMLYFICNLICLTERKSIYDDNPWAVMKAVEFLCHGKVSAGECH